MSIARPVFVPGFGTAIEHRCVALLYSDNVIGPFEISTY